MKQLWHLNSMESLLTNAEGNPAIHSICMDVEDIMRGEKKTGRARQILYDLTHMWNLK